MGLLARAPEDAVRSFFDSFNDLPTFTELRAPEAGMVMVRGRIGGSGAAFNLGEMTVTRCSVLALGKAGHAMVQGRRFEHARLAALADALLQDQEWRRVVESGLIEPLRQAERQKAVRRADEAAATKVDFFTMVRGEDEK